MTPQTVWVGGQHPCDTPQFASRAPATVLKEKLLEALTATPGASVSDLRKVFPDAAPKTINSALSRQEQGGRVFSRRCLEAFDDTKARRWIHRWYLTGRNWT